MPADVPPTVKPATKKLTASRSAEVTEKPSRNTATAPTSSPMMTVSLASPLSMMRPIIGAPITAPKLLAEIISEALEIGRPASRSTGTVQASTVISTSQQQKNDTQ